MGAASGAIGSMNQSVNNTATQYPAVTGSTPGTKGGTASSPAPNYGVGVPTSQTNSLGSKGVGTATTPTNQPVGYQATPQVYQQSYTQPTYNPMGGNTGMTGGNMYSQPTFSQGYNNPQGPQAIQQPMYQNYGYQQQQPYQQQPQGGFQQQPMGGGKGGAQAQPAPQPAPTTSSAPGQKGAGSATPAPQPAPTTSSAPGGKGAGAATPSTSIPTTPAAPMTGNTSTYDPATQTYTTGPAV